MQYSNAPTNVYVPPPPVDLMPTKGAWVVNMHGIESDKEMNKWSNVIHNDDNWGSEVVLMKKNNQTVSLLNENDLHSDDDEDEVEYGMDGIIDDIVTGAFHPLTKEMFGHVLQFMSIGKLSGAHSLFSSGGGNQEMNTAPMSFLATLSFAVNKEPSKENRVGQKIHLAYAWNRHKQYFTISPTKSLAVLECGMKILSCFLPENEKIPHRNALATVPCTMVNDWLYVTMYNEYAHIVAKLMSLPICLAGYKAKWKPILVLKNMLVVYDKHRGLNDYRVTTTNMMNKSYVTLVGFWKQCSNDERSFKCISLSQNHIPITVAQSHMIE